MNEEDDGALEEALMRQRRPEKPDEIREARRQMEGLLVPGLMRGGLSEAEARVEAMNEVARFERLAIARALRDRVEGRSHG